jgi:flagellar biosynthesis/type III secretory pathway protein FliH
MSEDQRIFRLDRDAKMEVHDFELPHLGEDAPTTFRTPSLGAGGELPKAKRAAVPPPSDDQKGRRFQVDPILRDLLSVDEETDTEIERRVETKISQLRSDALIQGREEGYEEGYARGKKEAQDTFEAAAQERLARMDAFVEAVEAMKNEVFLANERFLIELVFRIASNILQKEITADPEYVARIVRNVVEKVGVKEQLKLIASASQLEALYALLPELEKKHSSLKNISIEGSSQLEDSDVVIETDWNRIDATLESQLATLHASVVVGLEESQAAKAAAAANGDGAGEGEDKA